MEKLYIFGVGLIGGSIALKARSLNIFDEIVGIGRSGGNSLESLVTSGVLDYSSTEIDININKEQESTEERELLYDDSNSQVENVSLENVNYQNTMETQDSEEPTFEVDSIELATPELFSSKEEDRSMNVSKNENELFENSSLSKKDENIENSEPEMFDDSDSEEDFEIPAFLRRQKT